jgi:hypothetical protein
MHQYENKNAVVQLVTTEVGITCMKHLRAWMNAACEGVQQERFQVVHCRAALMKADGLMQLLEGLEGKDFNTFATHMLCKA